MPENLSNEILEIISLIQSKSLINDVFILNKALSQKKNHKTIFKIGALCIKENKLDAALIIFKALAEYSPDDVDVFYNLGLTHHLLNQNFEALDAYNKSLQINPKDAEIWINKSSLLNDLKKSTEALDASSEAININSNIPEAWFNKGLAHINMNCYQAGIDAYIKAVTLAPKYHEAWSNLGAAYYFLGLYQEGLNACDTSLSINPNYDEAYINKGIILNSTSQYEDSILEFDKVLSISPKNYKALSNKGISLTNLKKFSAALSCFDSALTINPNHPNSWFNKASLLCELGKYDDAINCYEKSLSLNPNIDWAEGEIAHLKMKICFWDKFDENLEKIVYKISNNEKAITPFSLLSLIDNPKLHKKCSEIFVQNNNFISPSSGEKYQKNNKIKIGYFSADFHDHATSYLMAELFELHNKNIFEIYAFSYGSQKNGYFQERIRVAFDFFIDVSSKTDIEISTLCKELNIDIAVDLKGFTQGARVKLFSQKVAPIQIQYLGYPGTLGSDYYDYVIADKTVVYESNREFFQENVIFLPNCYQVNDRKKIIPHQVFTKKDFQIPDNCFVFCCFNNNYKITPKIFDSWMRILHAIPDSILWLYEDNKDASKNLKFEASKRNINPNRLLFAKKLDLNDHLSRHYLADLFLDTYPYNAHTTASDALWCGLPVITKYGQSFASRVAFSLLKATGTEELAVASIEEYEALAISLAKDHSKLSSIKQKLIANRFNCMLFDTPLFTKNIESAYLKIISNRDLGLPYKDIQIH